MSKTQTKETIVASEAQQLLNGLVAEVKAQGYTKELPLVLETDKEAASIVWTIVRGEETPRIFLLSVDPDDWDKVKPEWVQQRSWELTPQDTAADQYPHFAQVVTTENRTRSFSIEYPPHEIDRLPKTSEISDYSRIKANPTYRWSLKQYDRLMRGFDAFHEQVYQNVKDKVNNKNDIILEIAKVLFLESFRLHHPGITFSFDDQTLDFSDIFKVSYVKSQKKEAVDKIQAAFDQFKSHEDYVVTLDSGYHEAIFDAQTHLRLSRWENLVTILELIQDLGPVTDNNNNVVSQNGTLKDIDADVLGRVFDVFLRANFESKGGLGVYLTPAPVKHAAVEIAVHDMLQEPELFSRDADGEPAFRFCDPACGSYGFGVVLISYLERAIKEILSKDTIDEVRRDQLFKDMCEYSFVGADAAPMMVTLARINMALLGAPKAKIFATEDSLETKQLKPCSFDLICTNPPFGTPKFAKNQAEAKKNYEEKKEKTLSLFRSDLHLREGKKEEFDYEPSVSGLAMGGKPNSKGVWGPVSPRSIDPAVLFIDRCLQLLKPGGRLMIIVPDGVLCNSGDRYVREYIMGTKDEVTGQFHGGKAIVKAVISLPADTFKLSGTGAKTSILYLQKRHARENNADRFINEPQTDVFMAVADTLGYVVKNNVEDYSTGVENDLARIVGAYKRGE